MVLEDFFASYCHCEFLRFFLRKTFFHNPRKSFVVIFSVSCIHFMSLPFSADPELHDQGLPGEQVRRLPLSGLGEHSGVVHNLLLRGVHPHSRLVQDRPRRGQPLGAHQPTYHCQVPRYTCNIRQILTKVLFVTMIVNSPDWGPKMPPTAGPEEGVYSTSTSILFYLSVYSFSVLGGVFPKQR